MKKVTYGGVTDNGFDVQNLQLIDLPGIMSLKMISMRTITICEI